jgi:hypothetical protein
MPPPTLAEALKLDPSGYDKEVIEAKIQHLKNPEKPRQPTDAQFNAFMALQEIIMRTNNPDSTPAKDTHQRAIAARDMLDGVGNLIDGADDDVREWVKEAQDRVEVQSPSKKEEEKLMWMVVLVRVGVIWGYNYGHLLQCVMHGWEDGLDVLEEACKVVALAELERKGKEETDGQPVGI